MHEAPDAADVDVRDEIRRTASAHRTRAPDQALARFEFAT